MNIAPVKPKTLAVIDGKSVFYRGYYAMPNLSTKDGTPTGGVYGFATMALEVVKRLKPDYVAVAWDKPKTNIRKRLEIYPEYKAGRKPAPPDFYEQIPLLHELLDAFGWPLYELDDYEADDIMGTLARQAGEQGLETMLITSDLDLLQVVNGHTNVYALKKGFSDIRQYNPETFTDKYGIEVAQFLDLKSLKGDSSDNIPGVPGIGEKTAVQLLQEWKTLDNIYENVGLIKDSVRKKLELGKASAEMSKKLAAIWTDAPIQLDLSEVDGSKVKPERVLEILQKLEFKSLARQLPDIMQVAITNHGSANGIVDPFGFQPKAQNTIIDTAPKLHKLGSELSGVNEVIIYGRGKGRHGREPQILLISPNDENVFTVMIEQLKRSDIKEALGACFENSQISKIGHDIKTTLQVCYELGFAVEGISHDTQIGAFLLDPIRREFGLTELAAAELDYEGSSLDDTDIDDLCSLAPHIVGVIRALTIRQIDQLQALPKVASLAQNIEWPVIPVLARMEYEGIQLDTDYLATFSVQINDTISDLEQQIYGHATTEFNIGSPSQLADILFITLGLPSTGIKKGKTGYSTAASELDKLRELHPIINLITQYREVTKLKNTYVDTLPTMVDDHSRVHTTFNLTIAQTGRLSSTDPNLQNIPVRTELGKHIRTAFIAAPGKLLVSADYSQFELRLAAVLADDVELIDMFNHGADIHTATAAQVYGRQMEDVTKQMRRAAKVINFGILYGMSPHGLAIAANMTREQAMHFIEKYKDLRRPLFDYMDKTREFARKEGYVETLFGRRRPSPDIHSSNFVVRQAAERAAINMPIQGTEADLMKMAMIVVDQKLADFSDAKQLLQIHDSILVECLESDAADIAKILKKTMEEIHKLPVKLLVDVTTAHNWGDL